MLISVICPVLNEAEHIQGLIEFFLRAAPAEKELWLIDGGSTDGTIEIIERNQHSHPGIHLLHNPHRVVPHALNQAIPKCRGQYIVRLDGHSVYAPDYFASILNTFDSTGADIVGGPTRTRYNNDIQEAIAFSITHPVGIGGSRVHDENYEGVTDSVTFGAWRQKIFEKTGLFDVSLVRNQDDEFHYRAKSMGFVVYQDPAIKLYYYPRSSIRGLFKQYFQYGLYKPLVLRKVRSEIKIRHVMPSGFVVYLFSFMWVNHVVLLLPLALYVVVIVWIALTSRKKWKVKLFVSIAIPCIHLAYGLGFLMGLFKLLKKNGKHRYGS